MNDSFNLTFVHVRAGPRGTSKSKKVTPGYRHPAIFKKMKRSLVPIKNKDKLCCARALVTAKAIVENHAQTQNSVKGRKIQEREAAKLHLEAKVPYGARGYNALKRFAELPYLKGYQLIIVDAERGLAPNNLTTGR